MEKGPLPDKDFETHFAVGGMESMAAFATTAPIPAFRFVTTGLYSSLNF
jgi:hypothetical protein